MKALVRSGSSTQMVWVGCGNSGGSTEKLGWVPPPVVLPGGKISPIVLKVPAISSPSLFMCSFVKFSVVRVVLCEKCY